jgi:CheY-like chemotaxis protein/anti-sigma regulatory factor (Ser/Thr protein kinase)
MVDDSVQEKTIQIALELHADNPWVDADQARMQQVLWNIVRNAVKFTPQGGRVTLRTATRDGLFTLSCSDTGIGIATEALPRIFHPFEQADAQVAHSYGGLGLGLAIAHGLMAQHGGTITASSDGRGTGATFSISLPCATGISAPAEVAAPAAQAPAASKRVLLVEDNEDAAMALAMCLEVYGYVVEHVGTCAAALQAARTRSFDAVLTDLGLPDGSGIDVGRALSPMLPVLALSGYGQEQDRKRSADAGFRAHLVKPADPAEVHAKLTQVLSGQRVGA